MRAVLSRGRPFRFCARGWSMAPFIRDGDVITLSPAQNRLPRVGEVVAFVRGSSNKLVVHRVVDCRAQALVIQGDNEPDYADGMVRLDDVLGRVDRIERNGRPIWLGLGPERYVIAWLSRTRRLVPLCVWVTRRVRPMLRRGS